MFGLTRREQRWKAEQQAAEVLVAMVGTMVRAAADIRVAEAQADADELARLRADNAALRQSAAEVPNDEVTGAPTTDATTGENE